MMAALLVGCGQQQTDAPGNDEPDQPALADGVYTADFNTDSSMFHANETCDGKGVLTVKDGQMTIHVSLRLHQHRQSVPRSEGGRPEGRRRAAPAHQGYRHLSRWPDRGGQRL